MITKTFYQYLKPFSNTLITNLNLNNLFINDLMRLKC